VKILNIYISQGSVAASSACIKCGGIFNDRFIANFLENMAVKELLILNVSRRYGQEYGVLLGRPER